ncbi:indoleamine 2,3-dioxygenase [Sodiomyces alkalinus F11]|uniref:Indoleamine 2,3-dioxygenase n=1 Tax=Sodiomyces alkalinus (strain CBS 110278 / VKM F-3762 / F11) TaxID=1314773 RepID=A0A3N2Q7X9_SODAK|nr:indoleamine 2,3-dioxygenase [Sodiomyces alkalinus F11]ROT42873.1 indoleamine 2,3-dioxygenase [Sodiomyces alkalinus F11]
MSPHAIPPTRDHISQEKAFLDKFAVTKNGFLPAEAPLRFLPDPYYAPWEKIVHHLPELLSSGTFHEKVDGLPVLEIDRLANEAEWRRAYVILTFLTHAFVWGGDRARERLPPAISIPLLRVSSRLELPPVATYAALNLWNFSSSNPNMDFTDLGRLESLHTFTGTRDEAWFYLVSVAMEAEGAHIVSSMLEALEAIKSRDYDTIIASLEVLTGSIRKIGALLERMYEGCDPMVFFYQIRPFLAGSKNMAAAGLPKGVFYDEGDGRGSWRQLRGGSNGQSSLIQFLDIVLGVEHASHGNANNANNANDADAPGNNSTKVTAGPGLQKPTEPTFHQQVREYMPGPHRRFLEHVTRLGSIRELSMLPHKTPEQDRLRETYQGAIHALTEFRNKHLQIVTRYIVLPSKRAACNGGKKMEGKVDLASASESCRDSQQLTGTGGTSLMPFLKQTRDETSQAAEWDRGRCI